MAGRRLTIDTSDGVDAAAPLPDRRGPNGTPRSSTSWLTSASTAAAQQETQPRSWLQSPRRWGQGHTPTNAGRGGGNLTPTSRRKAAYIATLPQQQQNGAALFGPEEEQEGEEAGAAQQPATSLASIVHQADKDGRYQQQPQAAEAVATASSSSSSESPSFLGWLLDRFSFTQSSSTKVAPTTKPNPADKRPSHGLLGPPHPEDAGKPCLVLDLDETLVHSSFQPVAGASFVVPIRIEQTWHQVYVTNRAGVHSFLRRVARHYEVVVFTASLSLYADPLLDVLDTEGVVRHRLYREDCTFRRGAYLKDLELLGRDLTQAILVDNSPLSIAQPENAILCSSFIDDPADRELDVIAAFLEDIAGCTDVREHCLGWRKWEQKVRARAGQQHSGKTGRGQRSGSYVEAG